MLFRSEEEKKHRYKPQKKDNVEVLNVKEKATNAGMDEDELKEKKCFYCDKVKASYLKATCNHIACNECMINSLVDLPSPNLNNPLCRCLKRKFTISPEIQKKARKIISKFKEQEIDPICCKCKKTKTEAILKIGCDHLMCFSCIDK